MWGQTLLSLPHPASTDRLRQLLAVTDRTAAIDFWSYVVVGIRIKTNRLLTLSFEHVISRSIRGKTHIGRGVESGITSACIAAKETACQQAKQRAAERGHTSLSRFEQQFRLPAHSRQRRE